MGVHDAPENFWLRIYGMVVAVLGILLWLDIVGTRRLLLEGAGGGAPG